MVAEAQVQTRGRLLVGLAVAALVCFLLRQLGMEWRINPQYSYGWVVPFLAVYLIYERWKFRPEAETSIRLVSLFILLLLALSPVRLIQEANPDWRFVSWLAALIVVGISWIAILYLGGAAWWRHFAFATAFILVAVPWPTPLENFFVQRLMQWIAAFAVEILNWMGIAAQQQGNLIQLASGSLGVDEACSGVRSFQATLMVSLFFGELYRLSIWKRVGLLALGGTIAVVFNFARALALALLASGKGIDAVELWHDPAGYFVLAATFVVLLAIARAFRTGAGPSENSCASSNVRLPIGAAIMVLLWLVFCEGTTLAWYRAHERNEEPQTRWSVDWPYERAKISENIRLVLRFDEGQAAIWNRGDGSQWRLFFFHWKAGRVAANLARNHRPETCLPATGFEFVSDRGVKIYSANGIELPIERLEFSTAGQRLHVYYCLWEDRTGLNSTAPLLLTRENRLRAVLEGRRHLGQRVLEVVIAGIDSPERADEAFGAELPKWIKMER